MDEGMDGRRVGPIMESGFHGEEMEDWWRVRRGGWLTQESTGSERPRAEPQTLLTEVLYLHSRLIVDAIVQRSSAALLLVSNLRKGRKLSLAQMLKVWFLCQNCMKGFTLKIK